MEVLYGEGGEGEPELELDDDPAACMRLDTTSVPTILTLSKVSAEQCIGGLGTPCGNGQLYIFAPMQCNEIENGHACTLLVNTRDL